MSTDLDRLCVNTLRFLSVDAVQRAESGHPGLPLDAAPMGYVVWTRHLKHNPKNPQWFDRDRFTLSAGHGSALLYSLLFMTGYDLPLEELKNFRQWNSMTPGHPERGRTPGVETTTGPLGQGFANGVGFAIAEAHLAARFNRPGHEIIGHYTYGIVSDGDLMEGVSQEAASLAGHLRLGKLIYLYDNNQVSLAAPTRITFTEDVAARFKAYGWHTQTLEDGNDLEAIDLALRTAKDELERPSLILVSTHLGYGSPLQDSFKAHGEPLGEDNVRKTKKNLGWPEEPPFYVPGEALDFFRRALARGGEAQSRWNEAVSSYTKAFPDLAAELKRLIKSELPPDWCTDIPVFEANATGIATRAASEKIMNAIAPRLPHLIGGSADLNPSTKSVLKGMGDFESPELGGKDEQGSSGGGMELRRAKYPLRRQGARDGVDPERPGDPRGDDPLRGHFPDLFRLHAAPDQAGSPDGGPGDLSLHPRQHRPGTGRAHASADRTPLWASRRAEAGRHPAVRRQRNGRRLANRDRDP